MRFFNPLAPLRGPPLLPLFASLSYNLFLVFASTSLKILKSLSLGVSFSSGLANSAIIESLFPILKNESLLPGVVVASQESPD